MSQSCHWPNVVRWLRRCFDPCRVRPPEARRPARLSVALLGGALLTLSAHAAMAGAGECNLPADTRGATLSLSEQDARAELTVTRPGSAGRKFKIEYNDEMFIGRFDAQGRAVVNFSLIAAANEISIRLAEIPVITCKLAVAEFAKVYRVVLRWRDPVQLDLDVVEPGRQPGGPGNINRGRANTDLKQGLGAIDVNIEPIEDGATGEISYAVANGAALLAAGVPTLRVDYVSRGARPEPPYCGDNPRASIPFELYVISRGDVKRSNFSTARARCGEVMAETARLMRLRQ